MEGTQEGGLSINPFKSFEPYDCIIYSFIHYIYLNCVLSTQFYYEPKTAQKKNLFKKFSTVHGSVMSDSL